MTKMPQRPIHTDIRTAGLRLASTDLLVISRIETEIKHRIFKSGLSSPTPEPRNTNPAGTRGHCGSIKDPGQCDARGSDARGSDRSHVPPSVSLERGTRTTLPPGPACREESHSVVSRGHPAGVPHRRPVRCRTDARMPWCLSARAELGERELEGLPRNVPSASHSQSQRWGQCPVPVGVGLLPPLQSGDCSFVTSWPSPGYTLLQQSTHGLRISNKCSLEGLRPTKGAFRGPPTVLQAQ